MDNNEKTNEIEVLEVENKEEKNEKIEELTMDKEVRKEPNQNKSD